MSYVHNARAQWSHDSFLHSHGHKCPRSVSPTLFSVAGEVITIRTSWYYYHGKHPAVVERMATVERDTGTQRNL